MKINGSSRNSSKKLIAKAISRQRNQNGSVIVPPRPGPCRPLIVSRSRGWFSNVFAHSTTILLSRQRIIFGIGTKDVKFAF